MNDNLGISSKKSKIILATRGGNRIGCEELKAHIASLLRLENVGLFLGSGTSCGNIGGKTVKQVLDLFIKQYRESYEWLIERSFITNDNTPNVEKLLDTLEIAFTEWSRLRWEDDLKQIIKARGDLCRSVILGALLKTSFWKDPQDMDTFYESLCDHRQLLQKITASRQPGQSAPWIFTTNYDLAIEWSAESIGLKLTNGFEGLHYRTFSPQVFDLGYHNLLAKGEARFGSYNINLVKLHGSLNWKISRDHSDYIEIPASSAWSGIKSFIKGTSNDLNCPMIFPSAAKYIQTVGFVLGELMRRFTDYLSRPQTCLFTCGYSFSDNHLNEFILRALQNPTLQIVIFLPEVKEKNNNLDFNDCSDWIKRINSLKSPQVTIVGGGDQAFFDKFVSLLPDPVIYDDQALQIRRTLKELKFEQNEGEESER